ncbi:hypothetical protein JCM10212_000533 [Sporobolomyces blumeae]
MSDYETSSESTPPSSPAVGSSKILELPKELLLNILELAIPDPDALLDEKGREERLDNLSSFSLVHPSWTALARELVARRNCTVQDEGFDVSILNHEALKRFPLRTIDWSGERPCWYECDFGGFDATTVRTIRMAGVDAEVGEINNFKNLEWFEIHALDALSVGTPLELPNLRRLAVSACLGPFSARSDDPATLFAPENLPSLKHLALSPAEPEEPLERVFGGVVQQVETLALKLFTRLPGEPYLLPIVDMLPSLPRLRHLSLAFGFAESWPFSDHKRQGGVDWEWLVDRVHNLDLESLHLDHQQAAKDWAAVLPNVVEGESTPSIVFVKMESEAPPFASFNSF